MRRGFQPKQSENKKIMNATKVDLGDGVIADSKLEAYLYGKLKMFRIPFIYQQPFVLQEGFRDEWGAAIRPITIVVDFFMKEHGFIVDTKGFQLADNKIKVKLLKYKMMKDYPDFRFKILKNRKDVDEFIALLIC